MPNAINTVKSAATIISKLAAGYLEDSTQFLKTIDKEPKSSFNQVNGYNPGDTITISKPAQFTMNNTADITSAIQDVVEQKTTLVLNNTRNVPIALTSQEIATDLSLQSWAERVLKPAMITLGNGIEAECLTSAKNAVYNSVGTAGSTMFDTDTMLSADEKLQLFLAPQDDEHYALLNSKATRSAVNARKGLFQQSTAIAEQYKAGYMGTADGLNYLRNNLLPTHTRGTATGAITVTTTVSTQGASTITLTGTGTQTLLAGDVFTVSSVFAVHPVTKAVYPDLQQFVVTANNTASGGTYTAVAVSPAMYTTGSRQNISAFPQSGATVTLIGNASTGYTQNFAYHKSAFRFVSVPLVMPDGVDMVAQETVNGITVRVLRDYQSLTDKLIMRCDVLYGFTAVRPEWAARITA